MILAVGGWRGSGTSVVALLLAWCAAMADETGAWMIEADPSGGVIAGRMQLPTAAIGGLERVAFPHGHTSPTDAFTAVAHTPSACGGRLHVVAAPVDPFRAYSCHQPRSAWWSSLAALPGHVVIDVGSLRAGAPVQPLLEVADHVLVVTSAEVSAVVASSEVLASGGRIAPTDARLASSNAQLAIVDAPGGVSFPPAELEQQLGAQCAGTIPWDPTTVDLLHRGAGPEERRLRKSALVVAGRRMWDVVSAAQPMTASTT